jgi:Transposase IS4
VTSDGTAWPKGLMCYFDNLFTSIPLYTQLLQQFTVYANGTYAKHVPPDVKEAGTKLQRGEYAVYSDHTHQFYCYAIYDSKVFYMLDTFHDPLETGPMHRNTIGVVGGRVLNAAMAHISYNTNMGGSDGFDQRQATYTTHQHRGSKYWHAPMKFGLDIAANNTCVILDKLQGTRNRRERLERLGLQLCGVGDGQHVLHARNQDPQIDPTVMHYVLKYSGERSARLRCAHCKSDTKPNYVCQICKKYLHLKCFPLFKHD